MFKQHTQPFALMVVAQRGDDLVKLPFCAGEKRTKRVEGVFSDSGKRRKRIEQHQCGRGEAACVQLPRQVFNRIV